MTSILDQMTALYVFTDDFFQAHPAQAHWRRSPNGTPAFSDAEVLTIALMQGCLGVATLKKAYRVIAENYCDAFPHLPSYAQWLARVHALAPVVGMLIQAALLPLPDALYLMDSKPIPVCKPLRPGRVRLLRDEGAYFGKATSGWFFGFQLHVLTHHTGTILTGTILCAFLTPANWQDRDVALALALAVDGGITLADLGYRGAAGSDLLGEEANLLLITPAGAGAHRALISSLRERIETSFSQLWNRVVDRVFSRSFTGLWNTIKLKMLHYNRCHAGLIPV